MAGGEPLRQPGGLQVHGAAGPAEPQDAGQGGRAARGGAGRDAARPGAGTPAGRAGVLGPAARQPRLQPAPRRPHARHRRPGRLPGLPARRAEPPTMSY